MSLVGRREDFEAGTGADAGDVAAEDPFVVMERVFFATPPWCCCGGCGGVVGCASTAAAEWCWKREKLLCVRVVLDGAIGGGDGGSLLLSSDPRLTGSADCTGVSSGETIWGSEYCRSRPPARMGEEEDKSW